MNYINGTANNNGLIYVKIITKSSSSINSKWTLCLFGDYWFVGSSTDSSGYPGKCDIHILPGSGMSNLQWNTAISSTSETPSLDIETFIGELPDLGEETRTFNIASWMFPLKITDELIAEAAEKGYTIALS